MEIGNLILKQRKLRHTNKINVFFILQKQHHKVISPTGLGARPALCVYCVSMFSDWDLRGSISSTPTCVYLWVELKGQTLKIGDRY